MQNKDKSSIYYLPIRFGKFTKYMIEETKKNPDKSGEGIYANSFAYAKQFRKKILIIYKVYELMANIFYNLVKIYNYIIMPFLNLF